MDSRDSTRAASRAAVLVLTLTTLGGCQTPIAYGPLDGEQTPIYGYRDAETRAGAYTVTIIALGGDPVSVHAMWDRRARELCGSAEYQKKLYRAERPTTHYGYHGGAPGNMILEGFLHCGTVAGVTVEPSKSAAEQGLR
jgi:hypothetical protein